ncbi:MAG: hypothetical protein AAB638_01335 [Patescibacteria group bacterium]
MLDVKKLWPLVVYSIMIPLNTDVIIPAGIISGRSQIFLWLYIPILATVEICYSFWFWGWVVRWIVELKKIQETRRELNKAGLLDKWVIDSVVNVYHAVMHPENGARKNINRYGVIAVWALGINPILGIPTRTPCAAFLGIFNRKREFYHLVLANLVHVFLVLGVWDYLFG